MKVSLKERFGEYCMRPFQGKQLYSLCKAAIRTRDVLVIDFFGVRVLSSDFMDEAFGKLSKDFSEETILSNLKFKLIREEHEQSIRFTIKFYRRYYLDEEYRYIIDSCAKKQAKKERAPRGKKIRKTEADGEPVCDIQPLVI